jgi:hypothetical protein
MVRLSALSAHHPLLPRNIRIKIREVFKWGMDNNGNIVHEILEQYNGRTTEQIEEIQC